MLADIAHGHTDAADVLFLIGAILIGLAAVFEYRAGTLNGGKPGSGVLLASGLCLVSIGWLIL